MSEFMKIALYFVASVLAATAIGLAIGGALS
jgi:hypothetical protein